jgi:hypothetical protein
MSPRLAGTTPAADTPRRAPRPTHVYKLVIEYPPGSLEPGWEPPGWDPLETDTDWVVDEYDEMRWAGWPQNRLYLSRTGAKRRADLLRKYGAAVEVVQSLPVEWPLPADGAS